MTDPDLLSEDEARATRDLVIKSKLHEEARLQQQFYTYFPDEGPLSRAHYLKHMEFFAAGAEFNERLFLAANRTGKSQSGAFEASCHLTGLYPSWWGGRRFIEPIEMWACGTTSETTREIVQGKLLGPHDRLGAGMVPSHLILDTTRRTHGLPGSIESAYIRHASGGKSLLGFKTYEQGRKSYEGTGKHVIWCDEEPPQDVYTECLYRTLTTQGIMFVTFTPLQGMSAVVRSFLEPSEESRDVKMYVQAGWDDVPHLDEKMKRQILATTPPFQIAARTKGEPSLGAGAIYPITESDIVVPARVYPDSWPKVYGMDVGWNRTAVVWAAQEVGTGILYVYDEHYMGQGEPPSHAMAIRARGEWIEGVIDPAANGRSQKDGSRLIDAYQSLGLKITPADHAVEAGLQTVWTLLISGRLKIGENCRNLLREFRGYCRDEEGKIVKGHDHACDALRYLVMSGREKMHPRPKLKSDREPEPPRRGETWMAG